MVHTNFSFSVVETRTKTGRTKYIYCPPKKNSKRIFCQRGRAVVLPSEDHEKWVKEMKKTLRGSEMLIPPYEIFIDFYTPNMVTGDLTNRAETINDLLKDAEIITDDEMIVLPNLHLTFKGIDKDNPRVEVLIISSD